MSYNHKQIEKKWQEKWEAEKPWKADDALKKPKYYCLVEFPYPSGAGLHVGHPRSYSAIDVIARKRRMQGYNVLYPMGWDAFGLPTENYAIKTGRPPQDITRENIDTFRRQLKSLGLSFDWSREVNTTDPEYYKWTQWMFLEFFKAGLAYKTKTMINWCPKDKIGLANEEAAGGVCDRCGGPVEKREKEQWMIRITDYAERLLRDLDTVDYLPKIKKQQQDWIGKSEGALIEFEVANPSGSVTPIIKAFTTRPDTLFGATYLVLSPEHELVEQVTTDAQMSEVQKYIVASKKKTEIERANDEKEKTGVFTGAYVYHPVSKEKLPIWIADYVMMGYGTGAIMAVPAHDSRDFAFAKKFELPIKQVVAKLYEDTTTKDAIRPDKETVRRSNVYIFLKHSSEDKYLCLDWEKFGWHSGIIGGVDEGEDPIEAAKREIQEETGYAHVRFDRQVGGVFHNHYFAAHKDVNRYAVGQNLLFRLKDEERVATKEEETKTAAHYIKHQDKESAQKLVVSNLRLVVKIALEYQRAFHNILDLIQEGNMGLMRAVTKYDAAKGTRFSYYASWWIRAYILKYIVDNFRLVKIGTTQAQKKLFYNLMKEKKKIEAMGFSPKSALLSETLNVKEKEVIEMEQRMGAPDMALDAPARGYEDKLNLDFFTSDIPAQDVTIEQNDLKKKLFENLGEFLSGLKDKERKIKLMF